MIDSQPTYGSQDSVLYVDFYAIVTRHCRRRRCVFWLSDHSFFHSFVRLAFTTISHERLEQSQWNLQAIFTSPYWWPD